MDKTYSELCGTPAFDWNIALDKAIAGKLTSAEIVELKSKANKWVTCACGNLCSIIPRQIIDGYKMKGEPIDHELSGLGYYFNAHITNQYWELAKETLQKIESRSKILIFQELQKLNENRPTEVA